jgi:membrane associated rhomboid family serine protease
MAYNQYRPTGFKTLPDVVKNLIIINVLMFIGGYITKAKFNYDITDKLGLYYIHSDLFKPYQFITHLFMHDLTNPAHVLLNMFALWMFGNMLENMWGARRFLIYYMVCGLGAALCHSIVTFIQIVRIEDAANLYISAPDADSFAAFVKNYFSGIEISNFNQLIDGMMTHPGDNMYSKSSIDIVHRLVELKKNIPTVGASGAVFGVLLAFGMTFPNTMIIPLFPPIPMKAKYFVLIYGGIEVYSGIANNPADNVAHFAHLGGMLFGFILIKIWNKTNRDQFY